MKRVVDTSVGRVVIDFYGDLVLGISVLDEHGWETREGEWGDAELAKGLFYVAGVPEEEAEAIQRQIESEWVARGGKPEGRWESNGMTWADILGVSLIVVLLGCLVIGIITVARWILGSL